MKGARLYCDYRENETLFVFLLFVSLRGGRKALISKKKSGILGDSLKGKELL